MEIMTPKHPPWREFIKRLCGPEGLNFRKVDGRWEWSCDNTIERPISHRILRDQYPTVNVEATMKYFEDHGGYCDCEIASNVDSKPKPNRAPGKIYREIEAQFKYLWEQWLDDQKHGERKDYGQVFAKHLEKYGATDVSMSESPFGFFYKLDGETYHLYTEDNKYSMRRCAPGSRMKP